MDFALAVARRLRLCEARQASGVHAAEFSVDIGGLHVEVCERSPGARIFVGPVEAGAGEQLYSAVIDARGHAIAVEFDLMKPLRAGRGAATSLESCGGTNCGSGELGWLRREGLP